MINKPVDITPYVSSTTDNVFALSNLPEEVIAVLFAYYSRSPNDLRSNLAALLADDELAIGQGTAQQLAIASEKARAFHEKWVIGYSHASVAEHSVVHLALENVSIIASKIIEDARLGSFTEKSTRYVVFGRDAFVVPSELPASVRDEYVATCSYLFETYLALVPQVVERLRARSPRPDNITEKAHENTLRATALDMCRGLLPTSTKTNIGLTANARTLAHLIQKMGAHPLAESRDLATSMTTAGRTVAPTLLKYIEPSKMHSELPSKMRELFKPALADVDAKALMHDQRGNSALIQCAAEAATHAIAHALAHQYAYTESSMLDMFMTIGSQPYEVVTDICRAALAARGPHEGAPRAFEVASYTVELVLDYGAYRDLQRHRMLSPYARELTPVLGHTVPPELHAIGDDLAEKYDVACREAAQTWLWIMESFSHDSPHARTVAQYVLPLANRVRVSWTLNLRELIHVIELRSGRGGHASYRALAQSLYHQLIECEPWLKGLIRVDLNDYSLSRT